MKWETDRRKSCIVDGGPSSRERRDRYEFADWLDKFKGRVHRNSDASTSVSVKTSHQLLVLVALTPLYRRLNPLLRQYATSIVSLVLPILALAG